MSETGGKIRVKVLYFAGLTEYTSVREERLELPQNLSMQTLISLLIEFQPKLGSATGRKLLATCACAVNLEYIDLQEDGINLKEGDTIALIPPVSGG